MIETELDHYKVVTAGLAGDGAANERTFASLAVLGERLKRLKELDQAFAGVEFSPDVGELRKKDTAVVVG
ncbi:MAG: hypothetical protein JW720_01890 [Sedimentisphaerales bacterium]|nr:hypothetical protein [Sedimentisphaerales bacterium]